MSLGSVLVSYLQLLLCQSRRLYTRLTQTFYFASPSYAARCFWLAFLLVDVCFRRTWCLDGWLVGGWCLVQYTADDDDLEGPDAGLGDDSGWKQVIWVGGATQK